MKASAPTQPVLILSLVLAVLGLLGHFGVIAALAPYTFWLVAAGYAVLLVGNLAKGL